MLPPILASAKYVAPSNADLKVYPIFRWMYHDSATGFRLARR
jgi:hypothetical protein